MIVGERKPLSEVKEMVRPYHKILVAGCDTCTAECLAGGRKQVAEMAAALDMAFRLEGEAKEIREISVDRQCIHEFLLDVLERAEEAEAVVSMACGAGVQALAERLGKPVFPGINTMFIGETVGGGVWQERCRGCGDCLLGVTGGLCPVTRCAKSLLNGPCGGSQGGRCEVSAVLKCDVPCIWAQIYERLAQQQGGLDRLKEYAPPKDWRPGGQMGPRQLVRGD